MDEQQIRNIIREELTSLFGTSGSDLVFPKHIQVLDGRNIQVGKTTGTKIGTSSTQKIAFYGITPIVQAGAISAPTGGSTTDVEARTAVNSIRTALTNLGLTA